MGLLSGLFGKNASKAELLYEIGTKIFNEVHGNYSLKISQSISGDADGNSEQEAYIEVSDMILRGDLSRDDLGGICEAYMQIRSNIIINRGGMPRWEPIYKQTVSNAKTSAVDEQKQRCTNRQNNNIELISVMKKNDRGDDGVFNRIANDLADYLEEVGEEEDPLRLMASGYVLRASAAGLVLQNIAGIDLYQQAFARFQLLQGTTQDSLNIKSGTQEGIDFQNEAASQAIELFKSYNPRLTQAVVYTMVTMLDQGNIANYGTDVGDQFVIDMMEELAPALFPDLT